MKQINFAQIAEDPVVSFSIVQGWPGWWDWLTGPGNNGRDPMFVDLLGPDGVPQTGDEDFRLLPDSPAINAGDPATPFDPDDTDLDGAPRIRGCRVDIGAYESDVDQLLGDFDGNDRFDLADFSGFQICLGADTSKPEWLETCLCVFDSNGNQAIDLLDYSNFESRLTSP